MNLFMTSRLPFVKIADSASPITSKCSILTAIGPASSTTLPLDRSIPFHSIIGDRGRGGNLDRDRPQSIDGIVPCWSSHLEEARSEVIIPSSHWSHLHADGMAEIRRLLLLHLDESKR